MSFISQRVYSLTGQSYAASGGESTLYEIETDQQHYVPLQIQDQGKGIEANVLQRLTERFYRGDSARPRGGMGLGLAIAQHICQFQGGRMHIESQLGKGTVVTLLLPVAT